MTLQIIDCEQGSLEWHRARAGIPTASMFGTVMRTSGRGEDGSSLTRRTYMLKLAGEIITGELADNYVNEHMERGRAMEGEARDLYAFMQDEPLLRVGFLRNGDMGASPDSLVGERGGLEVKTKLPHILIDAILKDDVPPEHMAQLQGNMMVAERDWWDLACFWPNLPLFAKRVYRDEPFIKRLSTAVDKFNAELAEVVEKVRRYGVAA